jgi:hypothetical protein
MDLNHISEEASVGVEWPSAIKKEDEEERKKSGLHRMRNGF